LIGANRVGDDQFCHYRGESLVCDSKGDTLAEAAPNRQQALTATLDFEKLDVVRTRFKVLEDRDF
jgi:predicted amidohydrolase